MALCFRGDSSPNRSQDRRGFSNNYDGTMMVVMGISIIQIFNVIIVENKNIMNPMQDERFEMNK